MTAVHIYLLIAAAFLVFLVVSRVWLWRKMGVGQRGAVYGTKYQSDAIEMMERQTKALERIALLLEAGQSEKR